jgi:hypothetical protein
MVDYKFITRGLRGHLSPDRYDALLVFVRDPRFRKLKHIASRLLFGSDLRSLSAFYGSDKWGGIHRYAQHYETHFASLRRKKIVLLEIGVGGYEAPESGGASLRMWRTYFPNGQISGIDIYDKTPHDEPRIKTFLGSQNDEVFLNRVVSEIGPPDIVIDDGSHMCDHVLSSFHVLFPKLKDGGYYVIEDTLTSYWPKFGGSDTNPDDPKTTVGYFKQLIHGLNHEERSDKGEASYYDISILGISMYHNIIFVKKGNNVEGTTRSWHEIVPEHCAVNQR